MVHPVPSLGGAIEVPGDKSISHRVAMLAALAKGKSVIRNFLQSEDCVNTLRAIESLGARTVVTDDGELTIQGTGGKLLEPVGPLNVGNSGTSIRLMAGILAGYPMSVEITGDESLCSRPMVRIKDPLERMGAKVELTGEKGTAPIRITGGKLKAIDYVLPVASAQVKSCVLLAGLFADGVTAVTEPVPTRDHTERMMRAFGIPVEIDGLHIRLTGSGGKAPAFNAGAFTVPGDFSSAAFWMVAVAARKRDGVLIKNVGLNPRRIALIDVLKRMGAAVEISPRGAADDCEPMGDVKVTGGTLTGIEVGGVDVPNLIDELPLVAALGALAEGKTVIRNAAELRVKESDRIATVVASLRTLGVQVEEQEDGMIIQGGAELKPSSACRSFGDHRIAMALAVLGTYATDKLIINNVNCVDTSYPAFWADLRKLGGHVE
jgi:3-phosphoshikimate 1-carboxyvinyltransferase